MLVRFEVVLVWLDWLKLLEFLLGVVGWVWIVYGYCLG